MCVIVPFDDDHGIGIAAFIGRPNSKGASLRPSLRINRGQKKWLRSNSITVIIGLGGRKGEAKEEKLSLTLAHASLGQSPS